MMNNEEFERKMTFIVEQQAQFAADMQRMEAAQTHIQTLHAETESVVARLAYATLEGFKDVNVKIDALVDAQIRLTDRHVRTEELLDRAAENIDRAGEKIDRAGEKIDRAGEKIDRTAENVACTDESIRRLGSKIDRLVDERLRERNP